MIVAKLWYLLMSPSQMKGGLCAVAHLWHVIADIPVANVHTVQAYQHNGKQHIRVFVLEYVMNMHLWWACVVHH